MKKFVLKHKDDKNKMENLTKNSTILQRTSQEAMLFLTTKVIPQLKDKINQLNPKVTQFPKKALALTLAPLFAITFSSCAEINDTKSLDNTGTSYSSTNTTPSLEDFESILKEYEQAVKDNDEERQSELDNKVKQQNYSKTIYDEIEKNIIMKLGCNPEEVEIVMGRDGFYVADKSKLDEGVYITPNGTVSRSVIMTINGKPVVISFEDQELLGKCTKASSSPTPLGIKGIADLYNALEDMKTELKSPENMPVLDER